MDVPAFECHPKGLTGRGGKARIAIIGQNPAKEDVKSKDVFQSRPGHLLRACIKATIDEPVWLTNGLCYATSTAERDHFEACWPRLKAELEYCGAQVVFTLGKAISDYFLGDDTFGQWRGCAYYHKQLGVWIIPTWSPIQPLFLEQESFVVDILRDLAKAKLYFDKVPDDFKVTSQVLDLEKSSRWLATMPQNKLATLDVETFQELDQLACLAISSGDDTVVFSREAVEGLTSDDWAPVLGHNWGFHNGIFDCYQLYKQYGFILPIVEDSMLQSFSLDNRSGGDGEDTNMNTQGVHGLKRLSAEYQGAGLYNINVKQTILNGEWDKLYTYNGKDSCNTIRLIEMFRPLQEAEEVRQLYLDKMIDQANVLLEQQIQGTPIDIKILGELAHHFGSEYIEREERLISMAWDMGWDNVKVTKSGKEIRTDINANSPKQLAHFLYDIRGLKPSSNAANRVGRMVVGASNRSTAEWALESLAGDPFVDNLLELRHVGKMFGTYVQGVDRNLDSLNRVHPSPKVHGTVTGRLSYTEPPVQTVPSDYGRTGGADFGRLRGLFAAHEGFVSWAADYEQAELWSMYMWSKDPVMLEDLLSGDFHTAASESMFQTKRSLHTAEVWQQIRFKSKFVTFGVAFGRSAISLSQNQLKGYSVRECQEFIDNWYKRYWVFRDWVNEQKRIIVDVGEQVTPTGRKFKYSVVLNKDAFRKCINHPVQSLAHDHLIESNIELHQKLKPYGAKIWFDVHDALLGEIPIGQEKEVAKLIVEVMERPRYSEIGIPVELKIGRSWRESTKVYARHEWKGEYA